MVGKGGGGPPPPMVQAHGRVWGGGVWGRYPKGASTVNLGKKLKHYGGPKKCQLPI